MHMFHKNETYAWMNSSQEDQDAFRKQMNVQFHANFKGNI